MSSEWDSAIESMSDEQLDQAPPVEPPEYEEPADPPERLDVKRRPPFDRKHLREWLEDMEPRIKEVATRHLSAGQLMKLSARAISRNPDLLQCTPVSVAASLLTAAQLGLDPSGTNQSAHLVPFNVKVDGGYVKECQLIPGYRGLMDLARRSGEVVAFNCQPVYDGDTLEIHQGSEPRVSHHVDHTAERSEDKLVCVYAVARLRSGSPIIDVMTVPEVERIRARSKMGSRGAWRSDFVEMARKTVVRRLIKYVPISLEAAEVIEQADRAEFPQLEHQPSVTFTEPPESGTKAERVAERFKPEEAS